MASGCGFVEKWLRLALAAAAVAPRLPRRPITQRSRAAAPAETMCMGSTRFWRTRCKTCGAHLIATHHLRRSASRRTAVSPAAAAGVCAACGGAGVCSSPGAALPPTTRRKGCSLARHGHAWVGSVVHLSAAGRRAQRRRRGRRKAFHLERPSFVFLRFTEVGPSEVKRPRSTASLASVA